MTSANGMFDPSASWPSVARCGPSTDVEGRPEKSRVQEARSCALVLERVGLSTDVGPQDVAAKHSCSLLFSHILRNVETANWRECPVVKPHLDGDETCACWQFNVRGKTLRW